MWVTKEDQYCYWLPEWYIYTIIHLLSVTFNHISVLLTT